jgi:hypothetical protein
MHCPEEFATRNRAAQSQEFSIFRVYRTRRKACHNLGRLVEQRLCTKRQHRIRRAARATGIFKTKRERDFLIIKNNNKTNRQYGTKRDYASTRVRTASGPKTLENHLYSDSQVLNFYFARSTIRHTRITFYSLFLYQFFTR